MIIKLCEVRQLGSECSLDSVYSEDDIELKKSIRLFVHLQSNIVHTYCTFRI